MSQRLKSRLARGASLVAVTVVAGLVLSACGADTAPDAGGADADRTLSIAAASAPNSLDPAQLVDGQQAMVWASIYDTLAYRENGTGEIKPNAAEGWEYSDDGLTLTISLRDGMTFSSGAPVNADAVVATMERSRTTPGLIQGRLKHVTSVEASDESTVVVTFDQFDPAFVPGLAQGLGAIADPATVDSDQTATNPVGSGPYTLDTASTVPGTSYVLERRDDYWNADAYPFSTVKVSVLQDPTASFNALQAGEINASTVGAQQLGPVSSDPAYTLTKIDATAGASLVVLDRGGEQFAPLGDERVRQAMSHAIDRAGILQSLLAGSGVVSEQIFNPAGRVYDAELNDSFSYDVDEAKALLAEAGYADGFTLSIPSTFLTTAFEPTLSQQMAEIGITLDWVPVPPQQAQSVLQSGDYGVAFQVIGFGADQFDAAYYYGPSGNLNPRGYTDPTLDGIFEKINTTVDFTEALPAYQELNEYAVEQQFVIPIVQIGSTWVTRDGVTYLDNGANGFSTIRLFGVAE